MTEATRRNLLAFDLLARSEEEEREAARWQESKARRLEEILRTIEPRERLADVGCFTGAWASRFYAAGAREIFGFDQSPFALERAARRGVRACHWEMDAEPCPGPDAFFDVVVAADVVEHLVSTDRFVAELRRIVRPAGRVLLTTPNLAFWLSRLRLLRGLVPWSHPGASSTVRRNPMVDLNHLRVTTASEWTALFEARGLRVERLEGWSILGGIGGKGLGWGVRKILDRLLSRRPTLAFGLLFVLRPDDARVLP